MSSKSSQLRIRKQSKVASSNNHKNGNHKASIKKITQRAVKQNGRRRENTRPSPFIQAICGDARHLPLAPNSIDMVLTSPAYWRKRNYQHPNQIGQERTAQQY